MKNLFTFVSIFNYVLIRLSNLSIILFLSVFLFTSCKDQKSYEQPELGLKTVQLLEADGYRFKDLNKNDKLDKYEDWRLTTDERVADLLGQMTLEEKVGFMLISTINMGGASGGGFGGNREVTSDLSEEDNINKTNFFTRQPLPVPTLSVSGTTKGILERNLRHFILRANTKASTIAEWANNVQAVAETSRLGIPVLITSNPRNHVTIDNSPGLVWEKRVFRNGLEN